MSNKERLNGIEVGTGYFDTVHYLSEILGIPYEIDFGLVKVERKEDK